MGIDFTNKTVDLTDSRRRSRAVRLQIWDTTEQEKYHALTQAYHRGCHGIVLVHDPTNRRSFGDLRRWMHSIKMHGSPSVQVLLVANKSDLQGAVTAEGAASWAAQPGLALHAVSAKENPGVSAAFMELAQMAWGVHENAILCKLQKPHKHVSAQTNASSNRSLEGEGEEAAEGEEGKEEGEGEEEEGGGAAAEGEVRV